MTWYMQQTDTVHEQLCIYYLNLNINLKSQQTVLL